MAPMGLRSRGVFLSLVSLMFVAWMIPCHADIQNSSLFKTQPKSSRSNSKNAEVHPPLRTLAPQHAVEVQRGGTVDIPIVMPPRMGAGLEIKIQNPPAYGDLVRLDAEPGTPIRLRYLHRRESSEPEDGFSILVRDPLSSVPGNMVPVRLLIRNPKADLVVDPEGPVDFGKIPLGCPVTREITIQNRYGSTVVGKLTVDAPWIIKGNPSIRIAEGESHTVQLAFDPETTGSESTSLRLDNPLVDFPSIILRGEGTAPFAIEGAPKIVLSQETPEATLTLKNSLKTPLSVSFSGVPSMVSGGARIDLPPMGEGSVTLAIAGTELAPDYLGNFRLSVSASTFRQTVDLQIVGPKAPPSLELLRGGDLLATKTGSILRLEGVVRNPSDTARPVELRFPVQGSSNAPAVSTLVIPPKGAVNFHNDWTADESGAREITVELRERGRLVDRQAWHVTAGVPPTPSPSLVPHSPRYKSQDPVTSGVFLASPKTTQKLVYGVTPTPLQGWILNHVALRWSYLGTDRPGFRVQTLVKKNALSDRTGEQSGPDWVDVKGLGPISDEGGGRWSIRLPFLMPGSHTFRVFPATDGDVLVNSLTLQISPRMAFWPPIRALLIVIIILLLVCWFGRRR